MKPYSGKAELTTDKIVISKTDLALVRRLLLEKWRAYAPRYAVAFVFMFIVSGCTALSAWLMKDVVNDIFVSRDQTALYWLPMVIVTVFTAKGAATFFQDVLLSRIGNRMVAETQKRMFDHLLRLDLNFYQAFPSGVLITRITHNAQAVRTALDLLATSFGRDLMTLVGLVGVMVIQDPMMSAICLLGAPIGLMVMRDLTRRVRGIAKNEVHSLSHVTNAMRETSQGIRVIKAFALEGVMKTRMYAAVEAVERLCNGMASVKARVNPLVDTLGGLAIAGVVFYAGWRSLSHGEAPGELFSFITALLLAYEPARRLARLQVQLTASCIGVRLMYELIDTPVTPDAPDAQALRVPAGELRLSAVTFGYGSRKTPVLQELDLVAEPGKTTALVGLSGSGKTTIMNLVLRFWDPWSGQVTIDGQDISKVTTASLRANVALVSQDVFLFDGSIRDNIRVGADAADAAAVIAAARAAHADHFIEAMPQGYDTRVGELGTMLSGGQRQRIAIARAFLKNAPIILLDEPTSALDSESEQAIQTALAKLTRKKTTIVIAHRLATVRNADRIYVIDQGRVAESGSHRELIEAQGLYARLYDIQFAEERKVAV